MWETQETWVLSLDQEDPMEKEMATCSNILPGKFHGQRSLLDYSPWVCRESDMTEELNTHTHTHTHTHRLPTLLVDSSFLLFSWLFSQQETTVVFSMNMCSQKKWKPGLPWRSSGWDSLFPLQEAGVGSLVRELRSHTPHSTCIKKRGGKWASNYFFGYILDFTDSWMWIHSSLNKIKHVFYTWHLVST